VIFIGDLANVSSRKGAKLAVRGGRQPPIAGGEKLTEEKPGNIPNPREIRKSSYAPLMRQTSS
jgi:hypothetical protein